MGILQGAILGLILFVIYINSLLSLERELKAIQGFKIIEHWLECSKFPLNLQETSYVALFL